MKKYLKFLRGVAQFRRFEMDGLQIVASVNVGFYPADKLAKARVEAQNTIPGLVPTEGNVDVFYLVEAGDGSKYIEILLQAVPGILVPAGYIWPVKEGGTANAAITDRMYNSRFIVVSDMDGAEVEFGYFSEYGGYYPLDEQLRFATLKRARPRAA